MDKRFLTMFSLLALTSLCLIYIGFQFYHLNYINDAQLGYAGAILGGSMTLIGVWWTIKDQDNKRKQDLVIQYRPIITVTEDIQTPTIIGDLAFVCHITLQNKGRGEASNITFSTTTNDNTIIIKDTYKSFLLSNDQITLEFYVCHKSKNMPIKDTDQFEISINVQYDDFFNNTYTQTFTYTIQKVSIISNNHTNIKDIFNNDNLFWKLKIINISSPQKIKI